jgi:hypothetical protein
MPFAIGISNQIDGEKAFSHSLLLLCSLCALFEHIFDIKQTTRLNFRKKLQTTKKNILI